MVINNCNFIYSCFASGIEMSTELINKTACITKEQVEWFDTTDKNFSKFVRRAIEKAMLGEIPFDILVVENKKGSGKS